MRLAGGAIAVVVVFDAVVVVVLAVRRTVNGFDFDKLPSACLRLAFGLSCVTSRLGCAPNQLDSPSNRPEFNLVPLSNRPDSAFE